MNRDENFQQAMQQIEHSLDKRLCEVKAEIMSSLEELLAERILTGREAILTALEKVTVADIKS